MRWILLIALANVISFGIAFAAGFALLQVLAYPFLYVVTTVLYYDLRVRKEGFDLELLASTLQPV